MKATHSSSCSSSCLRKANSFSSMASSIITKSSLSRSWREAISVNKLHINGVRDNAALVAFAEQTAHGFAAAFAIIERQLVDPHRDEAIGQRGIHVARELHRVL